MRGILKPLRYGHVIQLFLRRGKKFSQSHSIRIIKSHGMHIQDISLLIDQPCLGMGGMEMVKIQDFLRYTVAFPVQRRDVGKQLPEILICFFIQHPAAPAYKTFRWCAGTVVAAAEYGHPFQDMNPLSFPSRISDQIGRSRQGTEASAYKIDIVFSGRPVFIGGYCRIPFLLLCRTCFSICYCCTDSCGCHCYLK